MPDLPLAQTIYLIFFSNYPCQFSQFSHTYSCPLPVSFNQTLENYILLHSSILDYMQPSLLGLGINKWNGIIFIQPKKSLCQICLLLRLFVLSFSPIIHVNLANLVILTPAFYPCHLTKHLKTTFFSILPLLTTSSQAY